MFSLYYKIDDTFEIRNKKHVVNASFDNILKVIDLLREEQIPDRAKLSIALKMLFGKDTELVNYPLEEQADIFNYVFDRYVEKQEKTVKYDLLGNEMPSFEEDTKQSYSLKYDAEYIYSSFMQAYGIDLLQECGKLHWLKFKALLGGLPEDTKFRQVISIRTWKKPSSSKDSYNEQMRELQRIYALPDEKEGDEWQTEE
ncbi:Gp15 family bacteriophage protein [Lactococcus sp.]|uniref:Gp15 family bacteriophage protein n=1 Tax=Lactococcus sp. TaxID=44273 RepID=UPI0035B38EA3